MLKLMTGTTPISSLSGDSSKHSTRYEDDQYSVEDVAQFFLFSEYHQAVLRNVFAELHRLFENGNQGIISHAPSEAAPSVFPQNSSQAAIVSSGNSLNKFGKRRADGNDGLPDDDDGGGGRKRRRRAPPALDKVTIGPCFACPFFKRNPEKHRKWRSCAGPGWKTVHRMKYMIQIMTVYPVRLRLTIYKGTYISSPCASKYMSSLLLEL